MATLYVTEFATVGEEEVQVASRPGVAQNNVAITASSVASNAFSAQTRYIRIHADAVCSTSVGKNPTATTGSERIAADQTEYFKVQPGDKIAVIANT